MLQLATLAEREFTEKDNKDYLIICTEIE